MHESDAERLDLAEEFFDKPLGTHSPDLHALMNLMRGPRGGPHYVLLVVRADEEWRLAVMAQTAPGLPRPLEVTFDCIEDAERYVFKLRWEALGGRPLDMDSFPGGST